MAMGSLRYYPGITVVFLQDYCEMAAGLLWYCFGIPVGINAGLLGLLWYCYGIAVRLLRYCCGVDVGLLWDCGGIAVKLL